jgi:hypothetical protein
MRGAIPIVNPVHAIFDELQTKKRTDLKVDRYKSPDVEIVIQAMRDDCVDTSAHGQIVCG